MTDMNSDERLDRALRNAGRDTKISDNVIHDLDELVQALEVEATRKELTNSSIRPARRSVRRKWAVLIPVLVVGLVGAPVAAAAISSWTARTGEYGGTGTEIVDRSEWIGLDAEDAPSTIRELYNPDLELPEGASPSDVINPVSALLAKMGTVPDGEAGHVAAQTTTIQGLFERAGRCLWYREWLDANLHNDTVRQDAATAGIRRATAWPITVASDGGGVVAILQTAADAAAAGDRNAVLGAYGNCSNFYGIPSSK